MSLGQIIRQKREELRLTLDEVSRLTGFSKPYLSTIETGKVNPPSDELLTKLEKVLRFEQGLLLHIAPFEALPVDIKQEYETIEAENQHWRQIIRAIIKSKDPAGDINSMLSKGDLKPTEHNLKPGRLVPIVNKANEGYPVNFNDKNYLTGTADDYVRCPDLHDAHAFAVYVIGNDMEPKFHQGNIVVFAPAMEIQNGDDCFVRFATPQETTFRRIFFEENNSVRLQPRNEKYAPLIVSGKKIKYLYRAAVKYEKL